jgi:IS4 transposase
MSRGSRVKAAPTPLVFYRLKVEVETLAKNVKIDKVFNSRDVLEDALHRGIPVSNSGRNLGEILSLSYSEDLNLYSIDTVRAVAWGKVEVEYSRENDQKVCLSELHLSILLTPI